MNNNSTPSLRSLFQYKTLPFISKNPEGKEWGDKGSKRSPYHHQQAADPRHGCGQLATSRWSDGWRGFGIPFVLLDSLLQLADLTKRFFDLLASTAWFGKIHFNRFQPLWFTQIYPDSLISNLFWIKWAFGLVSLAYPLVMGLHFIKRNRTY